MKKLLFTVLLALIGLQVDAQYALPQEKVTVDKALFMFGDNMDWADPDMDDSSWNEVDATRYWNEQGFPIVEKSFAWYRIHVNIPKSLLNGADQKNVLILNIPKVDDVDECFLNGKLIGASGRMPSNESGYFSAHKDARNYVVDVKKDGIRWGEDNVIAVRVYNRRGSGGLFNNPLNVFCPQAAEGLSMRITDTNVGDYHCDVEVNNGFATSTSGKLEVTVTDRETGEVVSSVTKRLNIKRN